MTTDVMIVFYLMFAIQAFESETIRTIFIAETDLGPTGGGASFWKT